MLKNEFLNLKCQLKELGLEIIEKIKMTIGHWISIIFMNIKSLYRESLLVIKS